MDRTDHPVIHALREGTKLRPADIDFIIEHGHTYRGAPLPPGVERWPLGECLTGADDYEQRGFGRFIRGFVLLPGDRRPIPHAWASPDDARAYDPTLQDPRDNFYWGFPAGRHQDRIPGLVSRGFQSATDAGVPVSLMHGGLIAGQFKPWRFKM